ncbi:hypothetical protein niasHS_005110 [Heterodera schachtii]|uniref:Gland protein n=2 Tax=Heterodera TaxID=34509 RepID=A0ABD2JLW2_HETSC
MYKFLFFLHFCIIIKTISGLHCWNSNMILLSEMPEKGSVTVRQCPSGHQCVTANCWLGVGNYIVQKCVPDQPGARNYCKDFNNICQMGFFGMPIHCSSCKGDLCNGARN